MTEFRDLSKLPPDQRYWDSLESRITADLAPLVRSAPERRPVWWNPLAARAWVLGGLAAAAAVAAILLLPSRSAEPVSSPSGLLRMPADDAALFTLVAAPAPPEVGTLVLTPGGPR